MIRQLSLPAVSVQTAEALVQTCIGKANGTARGEIALVKLDCRNRRTLAGCMQELASRGWFCRYVYETNTIFVGFQEISLYLLVSWCPLAPLSRFYKLTRFLRSWEEYDREELESDRFIPGLDPKLEE